MRIRHLILTAIFILPCALQAQIAEAGEKIPCQRLEQKTLGEAVDWCLVGGENLFFVHGSWKDAAEQGIRHSAQASQAGRIVEHFERMDFLANGTVAP